MKGPTKNPRFPVSLAADGNQGPDAKAQGPCGGQDTAHGMAALFLAGLAVDAARSQLDAVSRLTDTPAPSLVEAADLLDAARAALDGAP